MNKYYFKLTNNSIYNYTIISKLIVATSKLIVIDK